MSNLPESPQSQPTPTESPPTVRRPWWVRLGLWGLPKRSSVGACIWLSMLLATGCAVAAYWWRPALVGLVFLISVYWYWAAMRWVDRHGEWK